MRQIIRVLKAIEPAHLQKSMQSLFAKIVQSAFQRAITS